MEQPVLYLVIPCYNEQEVLPDTIGELTGMLHSLIAKEQISSQSRMMFVDDGSRDETWAILSLAAKENPLVQGVKLAANAGHQNALMAGLMTVRDKCDCCISLDADLQDDIGTIPRFLEEYQNGCDVVYGVRNTRRTDSWFKRTTAHGFYGLMRFLGADIIKDHADYRLMSRRALAALSEFREVNLFLRGVVRLVGFRTATVLYDRFPRKAGKSKYPFRKMLSFAFDGITSFSIKPIRLVWGMGMTVCLFAVIAAIYTLISHLSGNTADGWSSLMISLWFLGGVQLISVGVIGEYVGKIYKETKHRPRYIIETTTNESRRV